MEQLMNEKYLEADLLYRVMIKLAFCNLSLLLGSGSGVGIQRFEVHKFNIRKRLPLWEEEKIGRSAIP